MRDVSIYCAWSCDMGKISVNDEILFENLREYMGIEEILRMA